MADLEADAARYRLLATAIGERTLAVVHTDGPVHTDGSVIAVNTTAPTELVRAQIVLHASLLAAGSLNPPLIRRLMTRQAATSRYLLLEAARLRDTVVATRLPAIARALNGPTVALTGGPQFSLRHALSRQPLPSTPADWGVIRPSLLWNAPLPSTEQTQPAATARFNSAEEDPDHEPEARRAVDRMFDAPGVEHSILSRILRNVFDSRSSTGRGRNNSGSAGEYSQSRGFRTGSVTTRLALPANAGSVQAGHVAANIVGWYPEWEVAKDRYLSHWCRVVELPRAPARRFGRPAPPDHRFRRQLARTGLHHDRRRCEPTGQDLDLDAVIRYQIDRAAGVDPGERIWLNHTMSRRDLAVLVLLDASGSAAEGAGSSVLAQHIAAASATVESLHRLGARVAAVSFEGHGRKLVRFTHLKHFHEHGTGGFRARISSVEPEGFTRLGAAIRHATTILRHEGGAGKQLLLVLSDGFPYDDGYEGRHATHDTRRALSEALRSGIGCLCLSYSEESPAAFEPATAATFNDLRDLEPRIGELFHRALASADLRRRYAPLDLN